MKLLATPTRLGIAVGLACAGAHAFASASVGSGIAEAELLSNSSPVLLRMSYALSMDHMAAGAANAVLAAVRTGDDDAAWIVAGHLHMAPRIDIDLSAERSKAARLGTFSRLPTDKPPEPAQEQLALTVSDYAQRRPWGTGAPDLVVDEEFNRLLLRYVRLQMPEPPMWRLPPPNAPVRPVQPPSDIAQPPDKLSPPESDVGSTSAHSPSGPAHVRRTQRVAAPRGPAWKLSDQAFKAYNRGDYALAMKHVDAALRLEPASVRLNQLRVYTLQKLGRKEDAKRAAEQAIARGLSSPALEAAVTNLASAPPGSAPTVTTPQYRKAFPIAALAYEQLAAGRFAEAASNAEIAVRTDPTQEAWALLWLNTLAAQQKYEEEIAAGQLALELGVPNRDAIGAALRFASRAIAADHAGRAYDALAKNQAKEAVIEARAAVRRAPDIESHNLLLISALQAAQDTAGAEVAATDALKLDDGNVNIRLQRAFLRQQLGRGEAAQADIDAILAEDWIDDTLRGNALMIDADLALARGDPQRVIELLKPLASDDSRANSRRAYAAFAQKRYADAIALARQALSGDPKNTANEALLTTTLASGNAAEQREALQRLDQAIAAQPGDANLLRQRGYLYLASSRPTLALQDFVAARITGNAPPTNLLDEAYATAATGRRAVAAAMLRQAIDDADEGKLPLDAQQRFDTRSAIANLSREWGFTASVGYRGARAPSSGLVGQPLALPGNAVFSTVEAYWRPPELLNSSTSTFEVYGRLSNTLHSGTDVTGAQLVPDPCGGGTIALAETRTQSVTGWPTTTGTVGARYTPWTERNLTFGVERQFSIGSATRSGGLNPSSNAIRCLLNQSASAVDYRTDAGAGAWQAYALYGFNEGTALRLDTKSWFTMDGYVQAGYTLLDAPTAFTLRDNTGQVLGSSDGKLKRGQAFAAGEARIGRSFLTDYNDRLVFFPHVSLAADWYSNRNRVSGSPVPGNASFELAGNDRSWSLGAGVGINVRYWFPGDRYQAQSSYVDGSLQYRTRLGGVADRAKGIFLNVTYSY